MKSLNNDRPAKEPNDADLDCQNIASTFCLCPEIRDENHHVDR